MKSASLPTQQELTDLRNLVLLYLCLETLEIRLMRVYSEGEREHIQRIVDAVSADFQRLRKQLKEAGITVFIDQQKDTGAGVNYPFICRGYEDKVMVLKDHFRAEIKVKLGEYKA